MVELKAINLPLRVNQIDANEFDVYIFEIIWNKMQDIFKYSRTSIFVNYHAEAVAFTKTAIWLFSFHKKGSTLGQRMLGMRYASLHSGSHMDQITKWQSVLYAVCTIFLPWMELRSEDIVDLLSPCYCLYMRKVLFGVRSLCSVVSLIHFCIFLTSGKFLHVYERILGLIPVHPQGRTLRDIGYEYANREILWHGFAEFAFFIMPFFNLQRLKRLLFGVGSSSTSMNVIRRCPLCDDVPINPQCVAGCDHTFCYHCIASTIISDGSLRCKACEVTILSLQELAPPANLPHARTSLSA